MDRDDNKAELEAALVDHSADVQVYIERHAAGLLRFESSQDLYSGLVLELLTRLPRFERRSTIENRAWLFEAARMHMGNRRRHWSALKRDSGRLMRTGMESAPGLLDEFAASQTGPSTFALRREQLVLLTQAMAVLPERDRRLVEFASRDLTNEAIAGELKIEVNAAAKAKSRALDRLRKAHELARRAQARKFDN